MHKLDASEIVILEKKNYLKNFSNHLLEYLIKSEHKIRTPIMSKMWLYYYLFIRNYKKKKKRFILV